MARTQNSVRERRSKYWVWTLNNPTQPEQHELNLFLDNIVRNGRGIGYIICQEEAGEQETRHYQGYVEFLSCITMRTVKRKLGIDRLHLEPRRGTQAEAILYCRKQDSRVEGGYTLEAGDPAEKKRDKLKLAVQAIREGKTVEQIAEDFPVQYFSHKEKIIDSVLEQKGKRDWPTEVHIFVGKTGTGKSNTANVLYPDAYRCPWPMGGRWWWPNYKGQETVIMDEFRHQIKMDTMLTLFDRYSMKLERKGGNMEFVSKRIIVTTNIDPKDWYPKVSKEDKEPLRRRLTENCWIWDFREGAEYPNFLRTLRIEPFQFNETQLESTENPFLYGNDRRNSKDDW